MPSALFDGLSSVDTVGRLILATTAAVLLAAMGAHVLLRARYRAIQEDLEHHGDPWPTFSHPVLGRIVRHAEAAARHSAERNTQAIIEDCFQSELKPLLLAERLVHLVTADGGAAADITQSVTHGLSQALTGMSVAFSNSLVGIASAVVLTVLGVVNNVTDRRTALMVQVETYLDRLLPGAPASRGDAAGTVAGLGEAVARLDAAVTRFDSALRRFAADTKDLREVQLVVALKPGDGR
jgi:hypothetical protein